MNNQAVCIVGMPRSGTSLIAQAIRLAGVDLGSDRVLMPALRNMNDEGFFELEEILQGQQAVLSAAGREGWHSTRPLPDGWWKNPAIAPGRETLARVVSREFAASPLWGWKSPPTGLLLPLWEDLAQGLGFSLRLVVVFRNPLDVARSLARVWNLPLSQSLRLWLYYMLAVFETVDRHPCLFVQYDEFLADPEAGAQRLGQFLKCADTALPEKVRGIVRPSLRHSWSSLADLAAKADPDLVALYQQCLDRLNGTQTSRPNQDRRLVATLEDYRQWARLADTDADRAPVTLDSAVIFDIGDDQDRVVANIIPYAPEGRFDERFALDPVGAKMVLFCPCPGSGKVFFRCRIEEVETDGEFRGIEHKNPGRQEEGWDLFAPGGQPYYKLAGDFTRATYVRIQGRIEVATV